MCVPIHFSNAQQPTNGLAPMMLDNILHMHTHTQIFHPSVAPSDYGGLTTYRLGPFSNDVRQLSFNVSIVNDNISEDAEMFRATLALDVDDQADLVTVSPDEAIVTILEDNDRRQSLRCILNINTTSCNVLAVLSMYYYSNKV